ncbi:MAG: OsmC family protein [Planctomycetes bacterium]|nr:OsmC family protein [Planctomycetota bacterium]
MTEVTLKRIEGFKFSAKNSQGHSAILDASKSIGGTEDGLRPMEMLLIGLAGCSSFDVLHILKKGRAQVEDVQVDVKGERSDGIPSVFEKIHLHFIVSADCSEAKLQRALNLSMEKYCSASAMLSKVAEITHSYELEILSK